MKGLICYPCGKKSEQYTVPSSVVYIELGAFMSCNSLASIDFPESLESIGNAAFNGCSSLVSIDLPASLSSLGSGVFSGCTGLTSINVDSDNSDYCSQDGILFAKDMTELICYPAEKEGTHYAVPSSVVSIESSAFNCCSLVSIDLPENLARIGGEAFMSCSGLTSVVFPEKLEVIESYAFGSCDALSSVVILSDSLQIYDLSFYGSLSVKEVLALGDTYPTVVKTYSNIFLFDGTGYTLYSFSGETLPEFWSAPAATVKLSLGGLSDKMPYTGKFPDLYIDGNASSYEMTVDESSMTFDTAPGTHTLDSFGFWLYKEGYEGDKTLVTINQPVTYTIEGADIDDAAASGIGCYPGVADDMLTVSGTVAGASLRVIDLSGAQRMSMACTDGETAVDVSCLAQGMYFVLVEDGGDVAARLRFVKK